LFAIIGAFLGVVGFFVGIISGQAILEAFARNGILFAEGIVGVFTLNLCGFMIWMWGCVLNYGIAHFIDLQIDSERNLRHIISKL
jgi:hypothetical protein